MEIVGFHQDGGETSTVLVSKSKSGIKLHYDASGPPYANAIPTSQVIFRRLFLLLKTKRAISQAMPFQLESCLPGDLDDFVVIPKVEKAKDGTHISIFAVQKSHLEAHLERILPHDPEVVTVAPVALAQFFRFSFPEKTSGIICHLGKREMDVVAIVSNQIVSAISLDIGFEQKESVAVELSRRLYFLQQKIGELPELILTGLFSQIENAQEEIGSVCNLPVEIVDDVSAKYAIAIGCGIDALDSQGVQLRQEAWVHRGYANKAWRSLLTTVGSVLGGAALVASLVGLLYSQKRRQLSDKVEQFITQHEKEMSNLRTHVAFDPDSSIDDLLITLRKLQKTFIRSQKGYNFYERPVLVTQILTWIISTPPIESGKVTIREFSYELEKYPKLDDPSKPYKTKISLKIDGESEQIDEFKNLLQKESIIVSQEQKVEWNETEGGSTASFYLKSRL